MVIGREILGSPAEVRQRVWTHCTPSRSALVEIDRSKELVVGTRGHSGCPGPGGSHRAFFRIRESADIVISGFAGHTSVDLDDPQPPAGVDGFVFGGYPDHGCLGPVWLVMFNPAALDFDGVEFAAAYQRGAGRIGE